MPSLLVILFVCFSQIWAYRLGPRIIDGQIAKEGEFPFAVAIYSRTSEGRFFCGGSILSEKWILTAGHCVYSATEFNIYLGINNLKEATSESGIIKAATWITHPEYKPGGLGHDIGLINLESPITLNDRVQAVTLPSERLSADESAAAVGWGATNDEGVFPLDVLYKVSMTTISNERCQNTYGNNIKDNMLCAVGTGNQGICDGDSGGPLVQIANDGQYIQVGVALFYGASGCETSHPSGFTRTFEYAEWIKRIIGEENEKEEIGEEVENISPEEIEENIPEKEEENNAEGVKEPESENIIDEKEEHNSSSSSSSIANFVLTIVAILVSVFSQL